MTPMVTCTKGNTRGRKAESSTSASTRLQRQMQCRNCQLATGWAPSYRGRVRGGVRGGPAPPAVADLALGRDSRAEVHSHLADVDKGEVVGCGRIHAGQLHQGGPTTALCLQVAADPEADLPVPGEPYSFGVLARSQALGDLQALDAAGRRVVKAPLGADPAAGIRRLAGLAA